MENISDEQRSKTEHGKRDEIIVTNHVRNKTTEHEKILSFQLHLCTSCKRRWFMVYDATNLYAR